MAKETHELIDGSKPIPVDRITYELAQRIVLTFDTYECLETKDAEIEVEARIGVLVNKEKKRVNFPMYTDAIIEPGFCDFIPGVEQHDYEEVLNILRNVNKEQIKKKGKREKESGMKLTMAKINTSKQDSQINNNIYNNPNEKEKVNEIENQTTLCDTYKFIKLKTRKSVDKYYTIKEEDNRIKKIRVTTYLDLADDADNNNNNNSNNNIVNNNNNSYNNRNSKNKYKNESVERSLYKENVLSWNVYLGNSYNSFVDSDSDSNDDSDNDDKKNKNEKRVNANTMDYRISINIEHKKNVSKLYLSKLTPTFERTKERTTFVNTYLGLQFDLTKVHNKEKEIDEIEIEIPTKSIWKAMSHLRNKNDYNYLYFICSNLINNVRGICGYLNYLKRSRQGGNELNNKKKISSHLNYECPIKEKKRFKKYFNEETPLIGDYMFRCVATNEKNIQKKVRDCTISNKEKLQLFKNSVEIRNFNKVILKKSAPNYVENLWQIINRDGKTEVALLNEQEERMRENVRGIQENGENVYNEEIGDNGEKQAEKHTEEVENAKTLDNSEIVQIVETVENAETAQNAQTERKEENKREKIHAKEMIGYSDTMPLVFDANGHKNAQQNYTSVLNKQLDK